MFATCKVILCILIFYLLNTGNEASRVPKAKPVPDLIYDDGYPIEIHRVNTDDAYSIELHRIPSRNGNSKRVALLPPCFLCSSFAWVLLGPKKALAYMLYENGYDVWMMNGRGSTYSMYNRNFHTRTEEFWDFSFHEMGEYDMTACIDYILEETNVPQLDVVSFSTGMAVTLAALSSKPKYANTIRRIAALSPVAYMGFVNSSLVEDTVNEIIEDAYSRGAFFEVPPDEWRLNQLLYMTCYRRPSACRRMITTTMNFKTKQTDMKKMAFYFLYYPDKSSVKLVHHYLQLIYSGEFQQYDYGTGMNLMKYGSPGPPKYDLSSVTPEIALFTSPTDTVNHRKDVEKLKSALPNVALHYSVRGKGFNHADFICGRNVHKSLYKRVLQYLFS